MNDPFSIESWNNRLREENTRLAYRLWLVERLMRELRIQSPQVSGALERILSAEPSKLEDVCQASPPTA